MKKFGFNYLKIFISKEHRNLAMDLILKNNLSYKKAKILESLDLEITISPKNKLKYESLFQKNGIVAKFSKSKGLIPFLRKYEKRYGIFLGALFLLLSVYASSLFVWRIDIEGNKNVPDEEIILQLENAGFSLGKFIPNVNYDTVPSLCPLLLLSCSFHSCPALSAPLCLPFQTAVHRRLQCRQNIFPPVPCINSHQIPGVSARCTGCPLGLFSL